MGELQQVLQYVDKYFVNANVPLAAVTTVLIQLIKWALPSPGGNGRTWKVVPQLKWFLPLCALLIGTILSFGLDTHENQTIKGKLTDGIQTGVYAIVLWELYSLWVKPFILDPILNRQKEQPTTGN